MEKLDGHVFCLCAVEDLGDLKSLAKIFPVVVILFSRVGILGVNVKPLESHGDLSNLFAYVI